MGEPAGSGAVGAKAKRFWVRLWGFGSSGFGALGFCGLEFRSKGALAFRFRSQILKPEPRNPVPNAVNRLHTLNPELQHPEPQTLKPEPGPRMSIPEAGNANDHEGHGDGLFRLHIQQVHLSVFGSFGWPPGV